ncbi:K(+)-transporting ATPase subunit F [Methylobacillus glycogenes]|mgnify:CR=1 FL=1|nr:K(+)-transporting ATPase subunit F [Methylobacillus glycogenes]MBL8506377.1 K(+)-transporting ATPase subunit F [Methylobacillus glycogenes]
MNILYAISGLIALGLMAYLLLALCQPERF